MATKTISITDEAYGILKSRKEESDSFSTVIVRLAGRKRLESFAGVLADDPADDLSKDIQRMRVIHRKRHKARMLRKE